MNSYQYAKQNNLLGTDAEIVEQLSVLGVTATSIDIACLMELLNFRAMLRKTDGSGGSERWVGTLQNLKGSLAKLGMVDAVAGYETWFSHVTNPRQSKWDTTRPEFSASFWQLYLVFADQPGMPTKADFEAIAALGGGWLFADLTVYKFQADKLAYEAEQVEIAARQQAEQTAEANRVRKQLTYSALVDAARWVETLEQCPTRTELSDYLDSNLPSEE